MGKVKTAIPGLDELIEGARTFNEPGVLVVMEETPSRIMRDMWRFGWDIERLVSEKKLKIIYANPFTYTIFVKTMKDRSGNVILEFLDCTTLMSSEIHGEPSFKVEEYLSSGVIRLHLFRMEGNRVKAIEILKMRGVKHDETLHPYEIGERGSIVYPRETVMNDEMKLFDAANNK